MCLNQHDGRFLPGSFRSTVVDDKRVVPAFGPTNIGWTAAVCSCVVGIEDCLQRFTAAGSGKSVPRARETEADGKRASQPV